MRVELEIFSGRLNPAWELTADEDSNLVTRLTGLPTAAPEFPPPALGYRGLVIFNPEGISGLPGKFRIYRSIVTFEGPEHKYYRDAQEIERWLWELGRTHGYGSVIDQIAKDDSE